MWFRWNSPATQFICTRKYDKRSLPKIAGRAKLLLSSSSASLDTVGNISFKLPLCLKQGSIFVLNSLVACAEGLAIRRSNEKPSGVPSSCVNAIKAGSTKYSAIPPTPLILSTSPLSRRNFCNPKILAASLKCKAVRSAPVSANSHTVSFIANLGTVIFAWIYTAALQLGSVLGGVKVERECL